MIKVETELKCKGCGIGLPKMECNTTTQRPNWIGRYEGWYLLEWICIECWDKGVRYENWEKIRYKG
jgi:hypothetical protein